MKHLHNSGSLVKEAKKKWRINRSTVKTELLACFMAALEAARMPFAVLVPKRFIMQDSDTVSVLNPGC